MISNFLNGLTRDTGIRIEQDGKTWCQLSMAADGSYPWKPVAEWLKAKFPNHRACKMCATLIYFAPNGDKAVPLRLRMGEGTPGRLVVVNHFTDCTPHLKSRKKADKAQHMMFEELEDRQEYPD